MPQAPSTRWCPTPEQLMILEEMYRNGVRTPNASQIQQITAHLSYYGKIEGKNVFYWFQNHKARDRQKLRRMLSKQQIQQQQQQQQLLQPCPQCPLLPQLYTQLLPQFLHQGEGFAEARQGMDLLGKLESGSGSIREEASSSGTSSTGYANCEWPAATVEPIYGEPPSFQQAPKTLELFPTKSTGLKDECSTSMSSSCSASTN